MNGQNRETDAPERSGASAAPAPARFPRRAMWCSCSASCSAPARCGAAHGRRCCWPSSARDSTTAPIRRSRGRISAVSYALSMSLAVAALWSFRRARGGVRPAIGLARRGFDGRLLLWGFVLILGLDTVLEPLVAWLPGPSSTIIGRGWGHAVPHWWSSPRCSRRRSAAAWCSGRCAPRSGVVAAWFFSSPLFGVLHLYPAQAIVAAVIGMVLGYVYIVSRVAPGPRSSSMPRTTSAPICCSRPGRATGRCGRRWADDGWYAAIYAGRGARARLGLDGPPQAARGSPPGRKNRPRRTNRRRAPL